MSKMSDEFVLDVLKLVQEYNLKIAEPSYSDCEYYRMQGVESVIEDLEALLERFK